MGLLDALFPDDNASGLLGFLKRNAELQPMSGPQPSDQANYGPAPTIPAPMNAMAQAPAPQPIAPVPANPPPVITAQQPIAAPAPGPNPFSGILNRGADALASIGRGGSLLGAVRGAYDDPQSQAAAVSNLTARALIAKGVDPQTAIAAVQPGNGEILKQLVDSNFGPNTKTSIGNGYVVDKRGSVTRAYTPDDKIPSGFAQDDNGNMHFVKGGPADPAYISQKNSLDNIPVGFQRAKNGGLEPIPGGPADPAYIRQKAQQGTDPNATHVLGKGSEIYKTDQDGTVTIIHKNDESGADATLSDETTKAMAAQYLAGDRTVMQNLGRGAQGAANIVKLREEITRQANAAGLDGKGIVDNFNEQAGALAGQRTVGTRAANISLAANEANNMIPVALAASEKVPRGNWMPWNKAVQAYQKGTSSPELASFVAATNSLVNAYVRAVSPGGVPTDSMREHAYSMLNSAQGPDAFKAVVSTMKMEMEAALQAPSQVQKELRRSSAEKSSPTEAPKAGAYTWSPDGGLSPK